jgi:hypothetical protein
MATGAAHTALTSSRSAMRARSDTGRTAATRRAPPASAPTRMSAGHSSPPAVFTDTRSGVSGCGSWRPASAASSSATLRPGTSAAMLSPTSCAGA